MWPLGRSPRWEENVRTFSGLAPDRAEENAHLVQPQWKHPKAIRRSARLKESGADKRP